MEDVLNKVEEDMRRKVEILERNPFYVWRRTQGIQVSMKEGRG